MPDSHPPTSLLLGRWHEGDDTALAQLLDGHREWLQQRAHHCMTAPVRAKLETVDLVQDVFVEFLRCAPRFTIENGKLFRALLFRILENTQREHYRWWSAQRRAIAQERPLPPETVLHLDAPQPDPGEAANQCESEALVRMGLELLEPDDQKLIVLRDFQQLSFVDIADRLDRTKDAVRMHYGRAVDRLAAIVGRLRRGGLGDLFEADELD